LPATLCEVEGGHLAIEATTYADNRKVGMAWSVAS
jgi:hypothetical protein